MITQLQHSGERFAAQPEHERLDAVIKGELFNELVDADIYTTTAPISRYIDHRLDVLCGEDIDRPQLFVRKDPTSKNAFAMPGVIVVDDGIFELLDSQEELDALLAHELTHVRRQHIEKSHDHSRGRVGKLGLTRASEIEADVLGMRLLDKRGINPAGMINLCEKLIELETDKRFASPTHGKAQDRKINLEQSLWLIDARHLSDEFTPIQLTPDEYGEPQHDVTNESLQRLSPMMQQRVLFRQAKASEEIDENLIKHQQELLKDEVVSSVETNLQARLILAKANPVYGDHPDFKPKDLKDINRFKELLQKTNVDSIAGSAFDISVAPIFTSYTVDTITRIASKKKLSDKDYDDLLDIAEYADAEGMSHELIDGVANKIITQPEMPPRAIETLGVVIAHSDLPRTFVRAGYGTFDDQTVERARLLYLAVSTERLTRAEYEADLVTSLVYAAKYGMQEGATDEAELEEKDYSDFRREYEAWGLEPDNKRLSDEQQDAVDIIWHNQDEDQDDSEWLSDVRASERKRAETENKNSFALQLEATINTYTPKETAHLLMASLQTEGGPSISELKDAAALAISVYREFEHSPSELLELYVLCGRTREVTGVLEQFALNATQAALGQKLSTTMEEVLEGLSEEDASAYDEYQVSNRLPFSARIQSGHKSFIAKLRSIEKLNQQFREIHPEFGVDIDVNIIDECDLVKDLMLIHSLARLTGKHADATELITLIHTLNPTRIREGGLFTIPEFASEANHLWEKAVEQILDMPNLMDDEQSLLALAALGLVSPDLEINLHIPSNAFARVAEMRDFEGALSLVSQEYVHLSGSMLRAALDVVIENKAKTAADFARINEVADELVQKLLYDKQELVGGASIVDAYVIDEYKTLRERERHVGLKADTIRGLESTRLMRALLMTGHDDSELKHYIAERWWIANRTTLDNSLQDKFRIENIAYMRQAGKEGRLQWWVNHDNPAPGQYSPLGETLDHLYLSTGAARYAAVRNLLLGKGGVLADEQGKASLIAGLMESWIDVNADSQEGKLLENLLFNIMSENPEDKVYQYIGPVLQDMILHTPNQPSSTEDIARIIATEGLDTMVERGIIRDPTQRDLDVITQKVITLMRGSGQNNSDGQELHARLLGIFEDTTEQVEFKHISPTELALVVGKRSGALGTRMLQLAGQYFEIPESERERFAEVYDNMKGQTRLQAFNVLEREAVYSTEIASLLKDVDQFDERLGGGSLVTVYGVTLKDGSKEVLGVRNPNAEFHVRRIADMLQRGIDKTTQREYDQSDLQLAQSLLIDAVEWIRDELNDTTFEAKDSIFRRENDTRSPASPFSKGHSSYDLKIPYTKPTGSLWVRREEYIPGKNLNSLTITHDGMTNITEGKISQSDYKDAISLLVRNYTYQLMKGSVAHSDIHPGNFRITPDNKELVVFDRYNLIPVTGELRTALGATFRSLISGNREDALESVIDFSLEQSEDNKELTPELRSELRELLNSNQDPTKMIGQMIITLKRGGVRVPIQLSLILRNIFGLTNLSQKAGFSNILEAFLHTADAQELTMFQEN